MIECNSSCQNIMANSWILSYFSLFTSFLWQLIQQSISDKFAHFVTWKPNNFFFFFNNSKQKDKCHLARGPNKISGICHLIVILSSVIFCISLKRQKSLYLKLWCMEREDEKRTQHLFLHHEHPCV